MAKVIITDNDHHIIVDDDDYEKLNKLKWHVNSQGYACTGHDSIRMHHTVLNVPQAVIGPMEVHHRNDHKTDNRKENLELVTRQRHRSYLGPNDNNSSGYKGVWRHVVRGVHKGRWRAKILVNGKKINLGMFNCAEDAARAYDEAAIKHFGPQAYQNFPTEHAHASTK